MDHVLRVFLLGVALQDVRFDGDHVDQGGFHGENKREEVFPQIRECGDKQLVKGKTTLERLLIGVNKGVVGKGGHAEDRVPKEGDHLQPEDNRHDLVGELVFAGEG